MKGKRTVSVIVLLTLPTIFAIAIAWIREPAVATWNYDQFMQAVEQDQVTAVIISPDYSQAKVTAKDGNQFVVKLPKHPDLLNKLTKKGIDVSIRSRLN